MAPAILSFFFFLPPPIMSWLYIIRRDNMLNLTITTSKHTFRWTDVTGPHAVSLIDLPGHFRDVGLQNERCAHARRMLAGLFQFALSPELACHLPRSKTDVQAPPADDNTFGCRCGLIDSNSNKNNNNVIPVIPQLPTWAPVFEVGHDDWSGLHFPRADVAPE